MKLQNVTVTLPADILREARHMAVDEGVSLSRFLALFLEERVESARRYREARERALSMMEKGWDLGTHGHMSWTRDELHER